MITLLLTVEIQTFDSTLNRIIKSVLYSDNSLFGQTALLTRPDGSGKTMSAVAISPGSRPRPGKSPSLVVRPQCKNNRAAQ